MIKVQGEMILVVFPDQETRILDKDNNVLFTYCGGLAIYDHVFIFPENSEDGVYARRRVFQFEPIYPDLMAGIQTLDFPQLRDLTSVEHTVQEALYARLAPDMRTSVDTLFDC